MVKQSLVRYVICGTKITRLVAFPKNIIIFALPILGKKLISIA